MIVIWMFVVYSNGFLLITGERCILHYTSTQSLGYCSVWLNGGKVKFTDSQGRGACLLACWVYIETRSRMGLALCGYNVIGEQLQFISAKLQHYFLHVTVFFINSIYIVNCIKEFTLTV